ncbi:DUF4198 domain-containing protein [Maridesulfovibrio sp.]|uniref:DUF4198 domain-containing protein n=1 Tax=Maridesulfovibrio sp. TaxID=2795000 RepID=UPI003BACF5C1
MKTQTAIQKASLFAATMLIAVFMTAPKAQAHSFWVNLFESKTHAPGHVISALGWGHTPPLDDLISSTEGSVNLETYELVTPDGKRISLGLPQTETRTDKHASYANIISGDAGIKKISRLPDSKAGVYQVCATCKPGFFTRYKDNKGKMRMAPKPLDELKDVEQVFESFRFSMNAKSFYAVEKWQRPTAMGYDLEIIPETDLSSMQTGEIVEFSVSFMGKPVTTNSNGINYMTLMSDTFGTPDGFFLSAYIMDGKAQFRIPTAGHWVANVLLPQEVTTKGTMKKYATKCRKNFSAASVSFTVKP